MKHDDLDMICIGLSLSLSLSLPVSFSRSLASMAVLTRSAIRDEMRCGNIKVTPFEDSQLGPASVDLTLSNEFRRFRPASRVIDIRGDTDYLKVTEKFYVNEDEAFLLPPGQTCLGITVEQIQLSGNLCGLLEGRSRFARLGLFVHITAGFMQPGIQNRQVLEIYNASNNVVQLWPGTRVCQFVFMRTEGEPEVYKGKFAHQDL